jgi:membrane protease YdiL (CAAX protease family)
MSFVTATAVGVREAIGLAAASAGMVLFAWCSHQAGPWAIVSAAGLVITASAIGWLQFGNAAPATLLGLGPLSVSTLAFAAAGIVLGITAGLFQRNSLALPLRPDGGIESFVVIACLIGAAEELVYRGWLFGRLCVFGSPTAVVVAAAAHAAYKTALFAWPPIPSEVDVVALAIGTFAGGILLGLLRVVSGHLIPAILTHAAFDFVVYAWVAKAPWWVWG